MKKIVLLLGVLAVLRINNAFAGQCGSISHCFDDACDYDNGYCDVCEAGYGFNDDHTACIPCADSHCLKEEWAIGVCYNYNECQDCEEGYQMVDGVCTEIKCIDNCFDDACDKSSGYCDVCKPGYGFNEDHTACIPCADSHCFKEDIGVCYGARWCDWCEDGWVSINGVCEQVVDSSNCGEGCGTCVSGGKCTQCESGYYQAQNGTCRQKEELAIPHCVRVNTYYSGTVIACSDCESGYILSEGECVTSDECVKKGYSVVVSSGTHCVPPGCDSTVSGDGNGSCYCRNRLVQENKCVNRCDEGYIAVYNNGSNGRGTCRPISCDVVTSVFAHGGVVCGTCKEGYYRQNGKCVSECQEGYISGTDGDGKISCFPAELGCGYGEKQVGNECVAREANEGCGVGFYLKNYLCIPESKGCGDGYLGKDGKCVSSSIGCGVGYKDMGGFCNRIRYTPAEAAAILNDDNTNSVTITFKK